MEFILVGTVSFLIVIGLRILHHKIPRTSPFTRNEIVATLLLFIGTGLIYVVSITGVQAKEIGKWSFDHWLQILLCWCMISGLIALNKRALHEETETLQWITAVGVAILLVVIPIGVWFTTPNAPRVAQQSNTVAQNKTNQNTWTKIVLPPNGRSELIPVPFKMHIVTDGYNHLIHNVYRDGHECTEKCADGDDPSIYITNELGTENIVYYTQVPKRN